MGKPRWRVNNLWGLIQLGTGEKCLDVQLKKRGYREGYVHPWNIRGMGDNKRGVLYKGKKKMFHLLYE
jgi:hypothetical protein